MEIFSILGYLINYAGGLNFNEHVVQRICPSEINENKFTKDIFETSCKEFFSKKRIESDLVIETDTSNCTSFKSKIICDTILNICKVSSFWVYDYLKLTEDIFEEVPLNGFYNKEEIGNIQRRKFLDAALIRHESDGKLAFYNDNNKAILVYRLLSLFASEDDEIILKSYFQTPWVTIIEYNKDKLLRKE